MPSLFTKKSSSASVQDSENSKKHCVLVGNQTPKATLQNECGYILPPSPHTIQRRRHIPVSQTVAYSWLSVQAVTDFANEKEKPTEMVQASSKAKTSAAERREATSENYFTHQPRQSAIREISNDHHNTNSHDRRVSFRPRIVLIRDLDTNNTAINNGAYEEVELLSGDTSLLGPEAEGARVECSLTDLDKAEA